MRKPLLNLRTMLAAGLLPALLTACTMPAGGGKAGGDAEWRPMDKEENVELKVAYFDQQSFLTLYGNLFRTKYPNVEFEVVPLSSVYGAPDPVEAMRELIEREQPDVLLLSEEQYGAFASEGLLYDLGPAIERDRFDLDNMHPGVIELLKGRGNGSLYGLAPESNSMVLYYNKDLFDRHGVPHPTDRMTWEELLALAEQFPSAGEGFERSYGLFQSGAGRTAFDLIRSIGEAKGLLVADADNARMTIAGEEWRSVFASVADRYRSGAVSMPPEPKPDGAAAPPNMMVVSPETMNFASGLSAMALDSAMGLGLLGAGGGFAVSSNDGTRPGAFDWDLVTVPVDASQPDATGGMTLPNVFAVNANSQHTAAAWELVKYINGEEAASMNAPNSPMLSSRPAFKREVEGKRLDAFYALAPNPTLLHQRLPSSFDKAFALAADREIRRIVRGEIGVDEALAALEAEGQTLLEQALGGE
ncbi:ABC transporter substrate-binding protein [Paenibacillus sp.]|uniref:ABC transporter substrate-binding protein n=1 Tax=Paenibacillus sp. TaxID=58172 RepID=UPI002D44E548|nr:extracellular solute-binding protein [Paenibacillus sp.]HZG84211.1 extracellular solute-binding protein [Paenibacillus sp.]